MPCPHTGFAFCLGLGLAQVLADEEDAAAKLEKGETTAPAKQALKIFLRVGLNIDLLD